MTGSTRLRGPSPRAASACEVIEIRRVISRPPPSVASNVGARMRLVPNEPFFGTDTDDATRLERFVERVDLDSARVIAMTGDLLAELKRRLRVAEAREEAEASGVRVRPTPPEGLERSSDLDPLADLEIDVELDLLGDLPEIEVAIAPRSESNFYGGFDADDPDGVFVATHLHLAVGTPVDVAVHLPAGYRFRAPAIVEFVREPEASTDEAPAGLGLRMRGLSGPTRGLIREFAVQRPPMFYID